MILNAKMVLKLEVGFTGAISPFAMDQMWFTLARFRMRGCPKGSRSAPRTLGRIAKAVVNERM